MRLKEVFAPIDKSIQVHNEAFALMSKCLSRQRSVHLHEGQTSRDLFTTLQLFEFTISPSPTTVYLLPTTTTTPTFS
jgi:hypothetical protein